MAERVASAALAALLASAAGAPAAPIPYHATIRLHWRSSLFAGRQFRTTDAEAEITIDYREGGAFAVTSVVFRENEPDTGQLDLFGGRADAIGVIAPAAGGRGVARLGPLAIGGTFYAADSYAASVENLEWSGEATGAGGVRFAVGDKLVLHGDAGGQFRRAGDVAASWDLLAGSGDTWIRFGEAVAPEPATLLPVGLALAIVRPRRR